MESIETSDKKANAKGAWPHLTLDDWAILVQKYRKELAVWLGDPKFDLAHPFEEKGTWNGEVTVDCCDKGKGGDK